MKNRVNTNKLNFNKSVVTELNDSQLSEVNGGTGIYCYIVKTIIETKIPIIA